MGFGIETLADNRAMAVETAFPNITVLISADAAVLGNPMVEEAGTGMNIYQWEHPMAQAHSLSIEQAPFQILSEHRWVCT